MTDYPSFTKAMGAAGLEVRVRRGPGLKRLLGVPGHSLEIGDAVLYAHEYPTEQALKDFQGSVDANGGTIPTSDGNGRIIVEWAPPRFYGQGKLLVLYFGHHQRTLEALDLLLGPSFAGG